MENLYLVRPSKEYQKSFEAYVLAYKEAGDDFYFNIYKKALENYDEYIKELHNNSEGIDIPEGWVPSSTFWLINNDEVVGVTRVRHQEVGQCGHIGCDISPNHRGKGYGTEMLKLALKEASKLGIKDAVATCNLDNIASKTMMEKNGGKLLGMVYDEWKKENLLKFTFET